MNKQNFLTRMLLLCALIIGGVSAWGATTWVKTDPASLKTGDIVVIVDQNSSTAMSNGNGTSAAPKASAVTLNGDKTLISSEVTATLQWEVTVSEGTYKFSVGENYLYCTATNNGVRVGSNSNNTFTIADNDGTGFLKNSATNRFLGVYNSSDWRCYTSVNTNINQTVTTFYKQTTISGAIDPTVTIDATTIGVGGYATISGPDELSISYSGYDDAIVSVDSEGKVTGLSAGTTTITATWSAVTDTYNAGSQNFTVTVKPATVYEKVTSMNQLVAGNKYIIVATDYNKAMGGVDGSIRTPVDITIKDDKVVIVDEAVAVLTLGGNSDGWTFYAADNEKYIALNSSSNALHTSTDATADAAKWTIDGDFQLTNVSLTSRVLKYNSGSPRFACYEKGQQPAVLFVKQGSNVSSTLTLAAACNDGAGNIYGTYSNSKAFIVPADLTVSAISVAGNKLTVTNYNKGDIVKANTGVMVSSTTAGEHTIILTNEAGTEIPGNMLKASGDAGKSAVEMNEANTSFYRLTMHEGKTIGFYWGAENGAAFTIAENKAYLAVPTALARVAGFNLFEEEGEATAIEGVKTIGTDAPVFNLNGQRVNGNAKGLLIKNGKKYMNR